jgi:hypothetical protein
MFAGSNADGRSAHAPAQHGGIGFSARPTTVPYRKLLQRDASCAPLREPAPGCCTGETAEITAA